MATALAATAHYTQPAQCLFPTFSPMESAYPLNIHTHKKTRNLMKIFVKINRSEFNKTSLIALKINGMPAQMAWMEYDRIVIKRRTNAAEWVLKNVRLISIEHHNINAFYVFMIFFLIFLVFVISIQFVPHVFLLHIPSFCAIITLFRALVFIYYLFKWFLMYALRIYYVFDAISLSMQEQKIEKKNVFHPCSHKRTRVSCNYVIL